MKTMLLGKKLEAKEEAAEEKLEAHEDDATSNSECDKSIVAKSER